MKTFFFFLLTFNLFLYPQVEPEVKVILDKDKYVLGETIPILITMSNKTNEIIDRSKKYKKVYFELINERGDSLSGFHPAGKTYGEKFKLLPGEERSFLTNLNMYFGRGKYGISITDFIETGKYQFLVIVEEFGNKVLKQRIPLEIIYPEGDDLKVFNAWAFDFKDLRRNFKNIEKSKKYTHSLKNLIDKYPYSTYSFMILDEMLVEYHFHQKDTQKEIEIEEFILKNYLTKIPFPFLRVFINKKTARADKITYLDKLLTNDFPITIKKYLLQMRKDIIEESRNEK